MFIRSFKCAVKGKLSNIKSYSILPLFLSLILLSSCAGTLKSVSISNTDKTKVSEILTKLPAENRDDENRYLSDIMKIGPDAVKYICMRLTPPGKGDDTQERYAVNGLTWYVHRPDAESERAAFVYALLWALDITDDKEVKAFLMHQIQMTGKAEAVVPLSPYLLDERLCEPAARALISIGTKTAEGALLNALPDVKGKNRITIIKALGEMRSKAAAYEIAKYTVDPDKDTRITALNAIANIGPFSTTDLLLEAEKMHSGFDRSKSVSILLLYAQRLSETGDKKECSKICRHIIRNYSTPGTENILIAALRALAKNEGESAVNEIMAAIDNTDKAVKQAALEIAEATPGAAITAGLFRKIRNAEPEIKGNLIKILNNRKTLNAVPGFLEDMGFVPLFNGSDLSGWKGLVGNPISRAKMTPAELAEAQQKADEIMRAHWKIEHGELQFDGKGSHLCTVRDYKDFEMYVDWKIGPYGDSGIYLKGSPQVQIWDPAQWPEGSGGLYNNQKNERKPPVCADNPIGEWNTFYIKMVGERVTVYLNDRLVVDNVIMENYWDRNQPIFPTGQIELQSHGSELFFRNIYIREIHQEEDFSELFNGKDFTGWTGATNSYYVEDGKIVCPPDGGGNLYAEQEFDNFVLRFEFRLTPGANNGLGIRAPLKGDAAYVGMELQILDNTAEIYAELQPYQYHGSIYGIVPAKRGFQKPVGEWNTEEVIAYGPRIVVNLNGTIIVNADIEKASTPNTMDKKDHPGLKRTKGHIGFLGHGSNVEFRNIRIKELK
ncbi:DUF1080 domain-containing protein [candidate division KSB1 bacterium]